MFLHKGRTGHNYSDKQGNSYIPPPKKKNSVCGGQMFAEIGRRTKVYFNKTNNRLTSAKSSLSLMTLVRCLNIFSA